MKDPFNPGIAVGKIVLTNSPGSRAEMVTGDYLPMKTVDGYMIRATQRRVLGRYDDAISDYDQAIALDSERGDIYFEKAQTYAAMKKKEAAISTFEVAAVLFSKVGCDKASAARRWVRRLQQTQSS
ncbi:MAG: tetratricopeptide repeat protein [Cyanobacteria bacterium P01_A01_bin.116]